MICPQCNTDLSRHGHKMSCSERTEARTDPTKDVRAKAATSDVPWKEYDVAAWFTELGDESSGIVTLVSGRDIEVAVAKGEAIRRLRSDRYLRRIHRCEGRDHEEQRQGAIDALVDHRSMRRHERSLAIIRAEIVTDGNTKHRRTT